MDKYQKLRWFIYARKSEDDKEKQVQSIPGQIKDLQDLQHRIGKLDIVDIIKEEQSAKEPGREKFDAMIRRIKKGEANGILIWAYHRLSRNPVDDGTIQWLLQCGTLQAIKTMDRLYLPEDNALLLRIEGGTANQFILDLKKNVRRGLKQKIDKGWKPGRAAIGYLNTKTEQRGENYIIPDPERFNIIRRAWDLMLTGRFTGSKILSIMSNEWGLSTPKSKHRGGKPLSTSAIYRMFSDPFYAGLFYVKGQLHQGKHQPMITLDEFDQVQILLGKKGRPRPKKHDFPFTGCITCGKCGAAITASEKIKLIKTTGKLKSYVFYHCTKRKKTDVPCTQKTYTTAKQLEEMIMQELNEITISDEFKDWAIALINNHYNGTAEEAARLMESQEKGLNTVHQELSNLTSLRLRDLIDDTEFIAHKTALQNRIVIMKQKLSETQNQAHDWKKQAKSIFEFVHSCVQRFKEGTDDEKKTILLTLGWNFELIDQKLLITRHKWLQAFKKYNKGVEDEIKQLEPENILAIKEQNNDLSSRLPLLCALVGEVGTKTEVIPINTAPYNARAA